jgi:hypothetical protein
LKKKKKKKTWTTAEPKPYSALYGNLLVLKEKLGLLNRLALLEPVVQNSINFNLRLDNTGCLALQLQPHLIVIYS